MDKNPACLIFELTSNQDVIAPKIPWQNFTFHGRWRHFHAVRQLISYTGNTLYTSNISKLDCWHWQRRLKTTATKWNWLLEIAASTGAKCHGHPLAPLWLNYTTPISSELCFFRLKCVWFLTLTKKERQN